MNIGGNILSSLPEVVKNLLIINILLFVGTLAASQASINLADHLGLHHWSSQLFKPYQLVSYIFMHGSFMHLFSNMFGLFMFGKTLEQVWGQKRFLIYYMITGIGAGVIQLLVAEFRISMLVNEIDPQLYQIVLREGLDVIQSGQNYADETARELNNLINISTVGASGAIFGILLAFGMLFPNTELMLLFFPFPIKAKYFVALYGAFELYQGFANNPNDNVAHYAHLGGMLFGFILLKFWQKKNNSFY